MTREEKKYLSRVADLGCAICRRLGHEDTPAMVHHQRTGVGKAQRAAHTNTIPLCHFHHQGQGGIHHLGLRAWERKFGITEVDLVAETKSQLGAQ
jgi:hypothetical protein